MKLHPAVAATRLAVRRALADLPRSALVLVAASGGADSTALALACAFQTRRAGWRAGLITVDHGLQDGSARRAEQLAGWALGRGFDPVRIVPAGVRTAGQGPEGDARLARYQALAEVAAELRAAAVVLGHTRDDQAETVLMRLARGAGGRSLAGIAPRREIYRRPFLALSRETTRQACRAQGVGFWEDPHNVDPAFTRARVRHDLLPTLGRVLGPAALAGLARTAELLRDDADALDGWAAGYLSGPDPLAVDSLGGLPRAVRGRVLRRAALSAGVAAGRLSWAHVAALEQLVSDWHGQGPVHLPGGLTGRRECGRLRIDAPASGPPGAPGGSARPGQRREHPESAG